MVSIVHACLRGTLVPLTILEWVMQQSGLKNYKDLLINNNHSIWHILPRSGQPQNLSDCMEGVCEAQFCVSHMPSDNLRSNMSFFSKEILMQSLIFSFEF